MYGRTLWALTVAVGIAVLAGCKTTGTGANNCDDLANEAASLASEFLEDPNDTALQCDILQVNIALLEMDCVEESEVGTTFELLEAAIDQLGC